MDLVNSAYLSFGFFMLCIMLSGALFVVWWNPLRIQKHFHDQGIRGPGYKPLLGNLMEIAQIHRQVKRSPPLPLPSESKSHHYMAERIFPYVPFWSIKYENIAAIIIFGKSAELGKRIGHLQVKLQDVTSKVLRIACIPGSRFIPNPLTSKCTWLRKEADKLIKELIKSRYLSKDEQENDFLGFLLSSALTQRQIEDECRVFSTAGNETISIALSWAFMLLGTHTVWQDKAREEIDELNMIVNETLRLYPPGLLVVREAKKDIRLEGVDVPGGTTFVIPILAIHYDKELWGDNAAEFDPSRFAEGAFKSSKHPKAFMPFTHGPRMCLGMNFALLEIRLVLATILQKFTFVTSPTYKHDPWYTLTMKPMHSLGNSTTIDFCFSSYVLETLC
ncbi:cytokinin hydroxylase-like [Elaeis guineensis]|uniref:cytokinin hydroxylase-like n=1 Tax=Elaeis guineensis var. tenera TaxID=51953 RepID=UPI003C6CCC43